MLFRSSSATSTAKPWRSAHRVYIRVSICAQSWASVPPAPAWINKNAPLLSIGSLNNVINFARCEFFANSSIAVKTSASSGDNSYSSLRFSYSLSSVFNSAICFSRFDFFCNTLRAEFGSFQKSAPFEISFNLSISDWILSGSKKPPYGRNVVTNLFQSFIKCCNHGIKYSNLFTYNQLFCVFLSKKYCARLENMIQCIQREGFS